MIVYEVNLDIDAGIADAYRSWLDRHVRSILALPGFTGARILEVLEPEPTAVRVSWSVQYTLVDMAAFDAYLRDHAPRMRADATASFGDGFRAQRRVLRDTAGCLAAGASNIFG